MRVHIDIEGHVAEHCEIVWAVVHAGSVPILVHDDTEGPVQLVLDDPMRAQDLIQLVFRPRRALR